MTERLLILAASVAVGGALLALYGWARRRGGAPVDRLDVDTFGLELMSGCCAFVVFTSPSCRPCKAALKVVSEAASNHPGLTEVTTIDAVERHDVAVTYEVRTLPTVFLVTASGHVVRRWRDVPNPVEVEAALAAI